MRTTSVKASATAFIESLGQTENSPFDIVAAMEEAMEKSFMKGSLHTPITPITNRQSLIYSSALTEVVGNDPIMGFMANQLAEFRERRRQAEAQWTKKSRKMSLYGRWGLQGDEEKLIEAATSNTESVEDYLTGLFYGIEKVNSRKQWKDEQNRPQNPENYGVLSEVDDDGNTVYMTYGLPPRTKGKSHVPAYYAMTGPKGGRIDLSLSQGKLKPKLCKNPNEAFRGFMTRKNKKVDGGEVEILNLILQAKPVEYTDARGEVHTAYQWLPACESKCVDGVWFVEVKWQLNPVCNIGHFHRVTNDDDVMLPFIENCNGELERYIPGIHSKDEVLTLSQLDYKLLCEDSGVKITDPHEEVVAYMNPDEELVMQGFIRDDDHADEEMDNYLLTSCASMMDRMIDLRIGSAVWLLDNFEETLFSLTKEVAKEARQAANMVNRHKLIMMKHAAESIAKAIKKLHSDDDKDEAKELHKTLVKLKARRDRIRARYRMERDDLLSQMKIVTDKATVHKDSSPTPQSKAPDAFSAPLPATVNVLKGHMDAKWKTVVIPGAFKEPRNTIEAPLAREVEVMPSHNTINVSLDDAKQLRRQKQIYASIIHGRFGMLVRQKNAQSEFANTLEEALRA